jgi:hypothetical protein
MNSTQLTKRLCAIGCLVAAACLSTSAFAQNADVQASAQLDPEPVAFSEEPELLFELRVPSFYPTDSSFDAFSDDDHYTGGMLGAGYDIGSFTVPGLRAYLLYVGGGADQSRFNGDLELSWTRNLFMAAADWGPELWGVFRPSARVGAGYALQALEVDTATSIKDDYAHDIVGLGSVGFEVSTPKKMFSGVQLSILGEFGYQAQTNATWDELEGGGNGGFETQEASLGDLNTNGVFWDLGLGLRVDL